MDQVTGKASPPPMVAADSIFPGDSEMARLMRAMDWANTDLGPTEQWPESWRAAVSLCLTSGIAIVLFLGPNFTVLYNDSYISFLGETKHPRYLGQPGRVCWSEIWDTIGPMLESVYTTARATWSEDVQYFFARRLPHEEVYVRFTYGPILAADGRSVTGIFCPCTETTEQVIGARRLETLRKLGVRAAEARSIEETCCEVVAALGENPQDIPFAALYLLDQAGDRATLQGAAGIPQSQALPLSASLEGDGGDVSEALARVLQSRHTEEISDLGALGERVLRGPWAEPVTRALVLPISAPARDALAGLLVAGVSPRLVLDARYRTFFDLIAGHVGTAIADARAYEQERKRAEALAEIDRAKTTFFSNVSHEFRTPLTLMLGPLEDLLAGGQDRQSPDVQAQLAVIHRNGLRLLKLVNTLLDFARIEAGRAQAVYEPTDLAAYTAELASSFRSLVEKAGMTLSVDCPPPADLTEPVYVDRGMWEKIVLNLLSNAFKFTLEGSIAVTVRSVNEGRAVELAVRDTGVGISAAELPRLFERFHRVEGTRARTHEGSGIGLALVQELVQLHGGSIRVESAEQVGTCVAVELPTGASHLPAERVQARPTLVSTALGVAPYIREAERWLPDDAAGSAGIGEDVPPELVLAGAVVGPAAQPDEGRRARIVLADDNADMRDYLRRLLSERYRVEAVANGAQALAAIRRDQPDLVLADVMMPEMDGFGLLGALRADPLTASLPVILLSARAGEEATIEGLEAGADDYLVKPFSAREVLSRVAARLEAAPVRREALQRASQLETIIESVTDAVFIYDRDGQLMRMNSAARTLFGLDERLDYGKLSPQERAALISACDEQGQPIPAEQSGLFQLLRGESLTGPNAPDVRLRLADGRELVVNITGAPLRDEAGAIVGAVAVSRDVTERRRLERARVLGLEAANARMDEFLGIASHELRTPLTSASGNVQMVERGLRALNEEGEALPEGLGEKLQHLLMLVRRTERQMGRLARLVGDLLDVSREQAGKLELRLEPCELLHIVREAVREQQAAWPDRSIVLQLPRRAVSLLGDADRLGQVVTNYLGNALKYAPKEEPVTVRVRVRNGVARVEVTDRGPGLTPEQQEGLFERFYRAPGIEQQNGSGMGLGLGLYICRTIVERHGGALGVRSHAGQGSTFWFTLPLATIKQEG